MKIISLIFLFVLSAYAQLLSGSNIPAIKVGSASISPGKIDSLTKQLAQAQAPGQNLPPETMTQLRWAVIDNLVGQELLKAEITKQGLKADAKKTDSLITLFKKQFPSEAVFKQELKKSGSTDAEFKQKIENQLLADQILEKKVPYPKDPTPQDKKNYWEKHKGEVILNDSIAGARIVLNIAKGENAQAIQDKKDILKGYAAQVRTKKANFAALAAQFSEDPSAKKDGGVMARFLPKDQGTEFVNAVKNLKVGDISEPFVQGGNKILIFMLSEKNDGKFESYEYQIDYILRVEAERSRQLAIKSYLDQLSKTYKVQYLNKDYMPPDAIGQYSSGQVTPTAPIAPKVAPATQAPVVVAPTTPAAPVVVAPAKPAAPIAQRVAVIQTLDDRDSVSITDLAYLTDRLRETAVKVLPKDRYGVMTTESIVAFLGSQERAVKICKEASCLAELGRKVSADYVAQGRIGRFGKDLTIKVELYDVKSGTLIGSFTGKSKDIYGLLSSIDKEAPLLFNNMPDVSGGTKK